MNSNELEAFHLDILAAARAAAEKHNVRVEQSGLSVALLVEALARCALAVSKAGDPKATGVMVFENSWDNGKVIVAVCHDGQWQELINDQ